MTETKKYFLSIIMPSLNEEKNIRSAVKCTLEAFDDFKIGGEVIVVNDGSTDRTSELVTGMMKSDDRISMISHDTPQGIGASFWDGVDNARGETVSMFPGDNENEPGEILRYCELMNQVDMVVPFIYNKEVRSLSRNGLSFLYRFIINTTFGINLNYTNGTVMYRKTILKELDYRNPGFFFQTDILIRLVKSGYLFAEVPCRLGIRNVGKSKAVSFPSLVEVAKGYLRLVKSCYGKGKSNGKIVNDTLTAKRYSDRGKPVLEKAPEFGELETLSREPFRG
ncbi:MAG: glycosyltransferase family 2 protein [bacterium]